MPDIFVFSKNISNYIYKEATVSQYSRVEIKVVKKLPYLPLKFGVLAPGQKNLRVEFLDTTKDYAISAPINEDGVAVIEVMPHGTYKMLVAPEVELPPADILELESTGQSVFDPNTVLPTSIDTVTVTSDLFIAPVIK